MLIQDFYITDTGGDVVDLRLEWRTELISPAARQSHFWGFKDAHVVSFHHHYMVRNSDLSPMAEDGRRSIPNTPQNRANEDVWGAVAKAVKLLGISIYTDMYFPFYRACTFQKCSNM